FLDLANVTDERTIPEHADHTLEETKRRAAIDRTGFMELIESDPPEEKEGLRALLFKVSDLEQAKAEMKKKGIRLAAEIKWGATKEAIYDARDLHGIRLGLVEYETPTFVDAMLADNASDYQI
ncbi:VOC family protein, partial [Chloroflexota bacterium]